jgi:xanthine dehydrogenase YagS FAD-binding subunit
LRKEVCKLRNFKHVNATSVNDAVELLDEHGDDAIVIAGGTDLISGWKRRILNTANTPTVVVNLKTIPDLNYINEDGDGLKIGALTTLEEIANDNTVKSNYRALAQGAKAVGSPHLRFMGTIAGNLAQETRCWYYRAKNNRFNCLRKPGGIACMLVQGDNRYGSIFGGPKGCYAVNNADTAPPLVALDASIKTNDRTIPIEDFFDTINPGHTMEKNEIITEIQVPSNGNSVGAFRKVAMRRSIDFAIASVAVVLNKSGSSVEDARIVLGAVGPEPVRATGAEDALNGNSISESTATNVANQAVSGTQSMSENGYKIDLTRNLVRDVILSLA